MTFSWGEGTRGSARAGPGRPRTSSVNLTAPGPVPAAQIGQVLRIPPRSPPGQAVEDLQAAVEGAVVGGVAEPQVRVAPAEDRPRDEQQLAPDGLGHELTARPRGCPGEEVERALRLHHLVAPAQA